MRATVKEQFKKIDRMVFRLERVFVVAALVVMSVVVFLDVVHRTFASEDNKGVTAFVKFLSYFGQDLERGDGRFEAIEQWFPYLLWAGFVGLGFLGLRTANTRTKIEPVRALAFSAAGVVVVYGLIRLFVTIMPNGLIWSQKLALVLTLWVGFIAASMCTHENKHLKVEAAQRLIPAKFKPFVVFVSATFTALVCFSLMWLATRYVLANYEDFVVTEGRGGIFKGLGVATWKCFAVLPLAFATMGIRFTARGIFALGGELPKDPGLEGIEALEKLERQQAQAAAGRPSEVPTEAAELEVADRPLPQSRVSTDPHSEERDRESGERDDESGESDDGAEEGER